MLLYFVLARFHKVRRRGIVEALFLHVVDFLRRYDLPRDNFFIPVRLIIFVSDFEAEKELSREVLGPVFIFNQLCDFCLSDLRVGKHLDDVAGDETQHEQDDRDRGTRTIVCVELLLLLIAQGDRK